ncbi:MAG: glycogen synthase [Thermodesulfobacteriota bacterium]
MPKNKKSPRVLIITPEVTYLPPGMGNIANYLTAKAGGLADVSAALIGALFEQGTDVHVALPDYRMMFDNGFSNLIKNQRKLFWQKMPGDRIHLAEDRAFFYMNRVYSSYGWENIKIALAFQREVINNIVPRVQPDLIHCNDWMTGLIPAMARAMGTPCLFTVHNVYTVKALLAHIEDRGIDAAYFWQNLYYESRPEQYEETRETIPVDFLASGIFAAHFVNTVSPTFLLEVAEGRHRFIEPQIQAELRNKHLAGCAVGILNAPDPSFDPSTDKNLKTAYGPENHPAGKKRNKLALQQSVGLIQNEKAPLFFWPHRLDHVQKGCQLLAEIMYAVISKYWDHQLEIIFVASGDFRQHFERIVNFHQLEDRVAICDFDERLACLAYGAADFILMPSLFEPCGLPQMIGPIYGALPVAHDTGGIHDTVKPLDVGRHTGNGFLFQYYDANGLFWAVDQAMDFFQLPSDLKKMEIARIMTESLAAFNHDVTARQYMDLYEMMLQRPLIAR